MIDRNDGAILNTDEGIRVARDLASAGIFIFPAIISWNKENHKLDKRPAIKGWRDAATTSLTQLEKWWHDLPNAVPGIELGRSRLFVVDLDRHPGGPDGVAAFRAIRGSNAPLCCPIVKTPSNGFHLYFRQPDGERLGNGRGSLPAGIDIRGAGGWTVAPGAVYKRWRWQYFRRGSPPPAPDWIIAAVRSRRTCEPSDARKLKPSGDAWLRALIRTVANAGIGERNSILFWASCRAAEAVRDGKAAESFVADVLIEAAMHSGLPEREAQRTVLSGLHRI